MCGIAWYQPPPLASLRISPAGFSTTPESSFPESSADSPLLVFTVPSAMKTLPSLVDLKNSYSSCNTHVRGFSVKASLTSFSIQPRVRSPLYLAYPECYSTASMYLCVTFVYCTYVITYTALDRNAFFPWPSPGCSASFLRSGISSSTSWRAST